MAVTSNRQLMDDSFRLTFEDASILAARGFPERAIQVRALDIDYSDHFDDNLTQILVGECQIDPRSIREFQGQEFTYLCGVPIA